MVWVLKKGADRKSIKAVFDEIKKKRSLKKGFEASRYAGTVKFKEDGLTLQKKWRNEWE